MNQYHIASRNKDMSLGTYYYRLRGPELLGTIAQADFNHVIIDHMFSPVDWGTTADLIAHARLAQLAAFVRVQTYPWATADEGDMRVVSDVARARMIGAAGAVVSISSVQQLAACVRAAEDPEHMFGVGHEPAERFQAGGWEALRQSVPDDLREFPVVAYLESPTLLENIDEIAAMPGLKAIGLGLHDIAFRSGQPFDVEHDDVWSAIDAVVAAAKPHDLNVWANTGYKFSRVPETVDRIVRMYERGVDVIQVQCPDQFLYAVFKDIHTESMKRVSD